VKRGNFLFPILTASGVSRSRPASFDASLTGCRYVPRQCYVDYKKRARPLFSKGLFSNFPHEILNA